jgi:hypothetical protein
MLEDEFHKLMDVQSRYHAVLLNAEAAANLHRVIFWQRLRKPVSARRCRLEPIEERLPDDLPSVEAHAIYEMPALEMVGGVMGRLRFDRRLE